MDICQGGDVLTAIIENVRFKEDQCKTFMTTILNTVSYIHEKGFVHRDLKPDNILFINKDLIDFSFIKLIDFGTAVPFKAGQKPLTEIIGTADYVAPEVINQSYDNRCDVWSIGCLAHMMLSGSPPFVENTEELTFAAIK